MANQVMVLVGTKKGAFVLDASADRRSWSVRGPYLEGQNIMHMSFDPRSGTLFAVGGDPWFGPQVHRSTDLGRTWQAPASAPAFPADSGLKVEKVWHVEPGRPEEPGVVYAGVEPAALFKSTDDGRSWQFIQGLTDHPSRKDWQPSAGGLCLHTIVLDPRYLQRMYVAVSAGGAFRTEDGGATWHASNTGTRNNFEGGPPVYPEWGQCVHKMAQAAARPDRLYQQNHCGVYRSDDGAQSWTEITEGLPSEWGLPMALHPRDADTVYVCPGQSGYVHIVPEGQMAVHCSRDAGRSWQKLTNGLPARDAYVNVMREGMAVDQAEPAGVYVGTNTGQLFGSADEGGSWQQLPGLYPPISSVGTITL